MEVFILPGVIFVALIIGVIAVDRRDKGSHSPFWVLFVLLFANYWMHWFEYPAFDWKSTLIHTSAYLAIGSVWSMFKWFIYLKKWWSVNKESTIDVKVPHASEHKYDLSVWILWWPLSVLNWVFGSLLVNIGEWLANLWQRIYDWIGVQVLGDVYKQKYLNNTK